MSHSASIKPYVMVFVALLILTGVTVATAYIDFGAFSLVVALAIAFVKASLVILIFMHAKDSEGVVRLFILASILWLALLIGIILADYLTRSWPNIPGKRTWVTESASQFVVKDGPPSIHH